MNNLKMVLFISLIAITFACNNTTKNNEEAVETDKVDTITASKADAIETDTVPTKQAEPPTEVRVDYNDSLDFKKYEVVAAKGLEKAPIDWNSYPNAKMFKTRIIEAYKDLEITFAGYYVTSVFGCGASCIMGFMVDVRDGKIYDLPLGEENSCFFAEDRALYNSSSKLFIAGVCKQNIEDTKVFYNAYLWNEDKKEFKKIEAAEFLKK